MLGNKRSRVRVLNPKAASVVVGDEVIIGINEQALVRGSLVVYTLPLLAMFAFGCNTVGGFGKDLQGWSERGQE